ncbi:hypothetical protein BOTBODRAFT_127668 [Botryobasidium botryosum FD-172 SS1]|uniref:G domain-containing protein n=1 Tax=Botryobasidium botryosum (strain FD-172 SS1) TaxID=930990 RepID=A0A067N4P2_BOTB1|nr:hypothetical protein BOTBODRAFT_127668 [Botryobasidium botryosum FD-172 SS1]
MSASQPEILIAIMGPTGSGKSSFIKHLCNNVQIGHGLESCTSEVYVTPAFRLENATIRLIDTPGFDDTTRTNTEILDEICKYLDLSYRAGMKLSGLIYLHKITDNRMGGISVTNMKMFQKLCGEDALKNVVLCTTMWDLVGAQVGEAREKQLKEQFWSRMLKRGAGVMRHDGSSQSAHAIISSMLGYDLVDLQIQDELVNQHKTLLETAAGEEINKEVLKLQAKYEQELASMKQQMNEALASKDVEMQRMIEEDRELYQGKLDELKRDHEALSRQRDAEMEGLRGEITRLQDANRGGFWRQLHRLIFGR